MSNLENVKPIKATRSTIEFATLIKVDGYLMPSGEFRVGETSACESVGFERNYLSRLQYSMPEQFKALQGAGYTGYSQEMEVNNTRGASRIKTISLNDYRELIYFAAFKGKSRAQILMKALMSISLDDFFRSAFAIPLMSMVEKKLLVEKYITSQYLEEQWEITDRRLPGDDIYLPTGIN
jgi:hypothetical protein